MHILPKAEPFFDDLEQHARLSHEAAEALGGLLTTGVDKGGGSAAIRLAIEQGEAIGQRLFEALRATFITPLDRGDLFRLTVALEALLGAIDEAAILEESLEARGPMQEAETITALVGELRSIVICLRDDKRHDAARQRCIALRGRRRRTSRALQKALGRLYCRASEPALATLSEARFKALDAVARRCGQAADVIHETLLDS